MYEQKKSIVAYVLVMLTVCMNLGVNLLFYSL